MYELKEYLEVIPEIHLYYFVYCLLPKDSAMQLIKQIRQNNESKEDNIKKICQAFLNEENPSWTKVYTALKEANCDDLADIVEEHVLRNFGGT